MNLKNPATMRNVTALVCAVVLAIFVSIFAFLQDDGYKKPQLSANAIIEKQVLAMPECAFKSNMLTVLGAHYGNTSDELNEILQAYSRMKIQEMTKSKSL